jgi:hypothetical protein
MSPNSSSLPPSYPPTGVPGSSPNTKYGVVAILLVLAAGGIFAWRSFSRVNAPAPAPPATVASAAPPSSPKLDEVPLPPPVEEKPEAGPSRRIAYVPTGGGCEGKCSGTAPPELGAALQVRAGQARRCYNQALSTDSSLRGHVTIAVRVGPGGNVCSANVATNDMGSPSVANCAANIFRMGGALPSPSGGCVDANIPLSFVPQGGP